ncbi:MAG TPA: ring-cleaving dioxygenase, partial [Longimicrobiaceae bacterium]|nr:ring-cleaving dioxygenase [Longimicrobiaceae bacterium]
VKRSVNQDDVSAYHLFYADAIGTPGTDVTFFDWSVPKEQRGTHSIHRTGLRVEGEPTLAWWADRFSEYGVPVSPVEMRDGRSTLDFEDPEGQRLSLVEDAGTGDAPVPWEASPVPAEYQIRGLGPIYLSVPRLQPTEVTLLKVLGMEKAREYSAPSRLGREVHVYRMPAGPGPHAEVHVVVEPEAPIARPGAGGVHHVAFRIPDEDHFPWAERLDELGVRNSGPVDRYYFRSLYFREPNGILFEIATDGPGFAVDEDTETLGEEIVLPPFLEPQRERIVANLKAIG